MPTTVCVGDDYRTRILLDGSLSAPALTLLPSPEDGGVAALTFQWTLEGSAFRIVSGTVHTPTLVVEIAGDQPLQLDLRVTNATGGSVDTTGTVSVTLLDEAGACPLLDAGCVGATADASPCGEGGACDAATNVSAQCSSGDAATDAEEDGG
jgi:hypothetical protein